MVGRTNEVHVTDLFTLHRLEQLRPYVFARIVNDGGNEAVEFSESAGNPVLR
jgi:hypothetical protein